jgi:hypothetical protein
MFDKLQLVAGSRQRAHPKKGDKLKLVKHHAAIFID